MFPTARHGASARLPSGFAILELLTVLMIAAVLMTFGAMGLNKAAAQRGAGSARDSYVWLARRGRALAIQRGTNVTVRLRSSTKQAKLMLGTTLVDQIAFDPQFQASVTLSSGDSVVICYTPRGIVSATCSFPVSGSTMTPMTVTFRRGVVSAVAVVQALGQVEAK